MAKYVYANMDDKVYDIEDTCDDPEKAIEWAMQGHEVAVLDAYSLEFVGYIH